MLNAISDAQKLNIFLEFVTALTALQNGDYKKIIKDAYGLTEAEKAEAATAKELIAKAAKVKLDLQELADLQNVYAAREDAIKLAEATNDEHAEQNKNDKASLALEIAAFKEIASAFEKEKANFATALVTYQKETEALDGAKKKLTDDQKTLQDNIRKVQALVG